MGVVNVSLVLLAQKLFSGLSLIMYHARHWHLVPLGISPPPFSGTSLFMPYSSPNQTIATY